MRTYVILLFLLLFSVRSFSQEIRNVVITYYEDSVLVRYDLPDYKNETYHVRLFWVKGEDQKLLEVSGDIGDSVLSGRDKSFWWFNKKEIERKATDSIDLKVVANLNVRPMVLVSELAGKKIKRGKEINVEWTGGTPGANSSLLIKSKGDNFKKSDINNTGNFLISGGKELPPGKYSIVIDSEGAPNSIRSGDFRITRKIPLTWAAAPVAGVGALVFWLIKKKMGPIPEPKGPG